MSLLNCVPCVSACQRASVVYMPTCLRANVPKGCQVPVSRANVPKIVPTCHKACQTACQFFNLACQRAKEHANFSNIPLTKC